MCDKIVLVIDMKKVLIIFCLLFLLVGCGKEENKEVVKKTITPITCNKALDLEAEGAVIVDVREEDEYNEDHLENAINIPYTVIDKEIGKYVDDYDSEIIVYCKSGKRSNIAATTLLEAGYKNIYDLGSISNCS